MYAIRSLVSARSLHLQCANVMNEAFLASGYCMDSRHWYGQKKKYLGLGLSRLTTVEVC